MEIPLIHQLPNELLVNIIEKLPRTEWPSLELIDRKFHDAVLVAWSSVRKVDMQRDFIYAESKAIKDENDRNYQMVEHNLQRQIAGKTEAILKKLYERSPFITSIVGLALITEDPTLNTTSVQYLAKFERLETIKFVSKHVSGRIVNNCDLRFSCGIPLINFIEFLESTQSRAILKEIDIDQWHIPNDPVVFANFEQRLRAAFVNNPNDPTRQLLQLESFSMRIIGGSRPLTFLDSIDGSQMKKLCLGNSDVEPTALTNLINRAPELQQINFGFLNNCWNYHRTTACQGGRLQSNKNLLAALASHRNLTSLGFDTIWNGGGCACHRFETEFKAMLRTIAPQLIKFDFKPSSLPSGIRMGDVRDIIQRHMPNLKSITLSGRCAEDPEEIRGIADYKELGEIEIVSCTFAANSTISDNYNAILNEVISTILSKSPRLKKFNGVYYQPDQRAVVELCKLNELIDLRIWANRLTKEDFVMLCQQMFTEKLQVLRLVRIGQGVEPGLIELVKKATQLRELHVGRNVSDKLLECLAQSCPNLEKFSASLANGITFEGIKILVHRCKKLRWLHAGGVDRPLTSALMNLKLDWYRKFELELPL